MSDNRQAFFDACIRGTSPRKGMAPHRGLALTNLFGSVRDELLGRSKIASHAPKQQHVPEIFGIVRCAHLMANRIPFVAQTHLDMHPELIGSDVLERVKFCTTEVAYEAVNELLDEPHAYAHYCDSLYDCIRQRDLVATLKRVL